MQDSDKKSRKNTWLQCISFFIVLAILLNVSSEVLLHAAVTTQNASLLKRNGAEADLRSQNKNSIDVLVLGDSEAYSSFSPLQVYHATGITSYVAAQPIQTMAEMKHMLSVGLAAQHPRVVMLETDTMYCDFGSVYGVNNVLEETLNGLFPVFQYHNLWKLIGNRQPRKWSSWKGYEMSSSVVPFTRVDSYMTPADQQKKPLWLNRMILQQIRQQVEDAGAQLVLYSSASPYYYNMEIHNYLTDLSEKWGITYIDLNTSANEIGIDWNKDTRDGGEHLNDAGAWKATDYLINILQGMNLPDHRGDPDYSGWGEMSDQFLQEVNDSINTIYSQK